jgi:hypothetical protein
MKKVGEKYDLVSILKCGVEIGPNREMNKSDKQICVNSPA